MAIGPLLSNYVVVATLVAGPTPNATTKRSCLLLSNCVMQTVCACIVWASCLVQTLK